MTGAAIWQVVSMIGETVLVDGVAVDNVLVEPGTARDAKEVTMPVGTVVDYTLRFPVNYEGAPLHDAKVTVRGVELDTLNYADHWRPADVFGTWSNPWDMTVLVGRTLGDYSATASVIAVQSVLNALGDPITTESTVYVGSVQARHSYGSEGTGSAEVEMPSETWYFVMPWQESFNELRPQSTYIIYLGNRYDVRMIKNLDNAYETASFEAVRHG